MIKRKQSILSYIVVAQFCCTSLWFAGNAVMSDLVTSFGLTETSIGILTSAVQFGFIFGTLIFAITATVDKYSPSKIFFICAMFGAFFNLLSIAPKNNLTSLIILKFLTGFCLSGIYPVGMKIASDYFEDGLGKSLSLLVAALVLGTAFPHLLKFIFADQSTPWEMVVYATSIFSMIGGFLILLFVKDGPYRKLSAEFRLSFSLSIFQNKNFKSATFGYIGHMWELYAFWTFVPIIIDYHNQINSTSLDVSFWSFIVISIGSLSCLIGGFLDHKIGTKKLAVFFLTSSTICCLLSPLLIGTSSSIILIIFLLIWGFMVIADSPLFSTLVAQCTDPKLKGTSLTIATCLGFAITIISIQLLSELRIHFDLSQILIALAIGPIFGLLYLRKRREQNVHDSRYRLTQ